MKTVWPALALLLLCATQQQQRERGPHRLHEVRPDCGWGGGESGSAGFSGAVPASGGFWAGEAPEVDGAPPL